jgi:hypothetical protein
LEAACCVRHVVICGENEVTGAGSGTCRRSHPNQAASVLYKREEMY